MPIITTDDTRIAICLVTDSHSPRCERESEAVGRCLADLGLDHQRVAHRPAGAPYFEGPEAPALSISHCRVAAAVAVSDAGHVGVDIEEPRQQLVHIAERFLSESELSEISTDINLLLKAWTAKEAAYKAFCSAFPTATPPVNFARDIKLSLPLMQTALMPMSETMVSVKLSYHHHGNMLVALAGPIITD